MQKNWFGYRLKILRGLDEIDLNDLETTDILLTPSKIQTGIYISEFIRWIGSTEDLTSWEEFIDSKHVVKEIKKAEEKLKQDGFVIQTTSLNEASGDMFIDLYQREVAGAKGGDRLVKVNVEAQERKGK